MYVWFVKYYLRNGTELNGVFKCEDKNSTEVANKLVAGADNEFVPIFCGCSERGVLLVRKGEIVAAEISLK